MEKQSTQAKSNQALREEAVLAFWKDQNIFEKTVAKDSPKGDFVFYEGPPTANAKPALHHLEARAFKDVIPRYKTMQGFHVRRRAGWDTHGLPVELQIEKKLGLTSKRQIEEYGIAKFNKECKDSVFTYIKDWETFTDRMGYWVDKKSAYYTFHNDYIESLWSIVGEINKRGLLYKDYKVVPWCPRCGTGLSSHELAQGYQDVKDLSVYAKFKVVGQDNAYIVAWTTTPWTLPGNVALAVGKDIDYVFVSYQFSEKIGVHDKLSGQKVHINKVLPNQILILAKEKLEILDDGYEIIKEVKGSDLVGVEYEPLFDDLQTHMQFSSLRKGEFSNWENGWKIYSADFVTTTDGTGVVHIAPMYGNDDFDLATKYKLPKLHTVNEAGHFMGSTDYLEGRFVKDEDVAVDIIKDLAARGQLFKKEKYEHSYPHCWRCKTPLLYYARDSWYVRMSELRDDLLKANSDINWEPTHIKEGRFGEWLREVKDWAFSRERYWGTPLPVWSDDEGNHHVIDSIETLKSLSPKSGNTYFVMRHGQTEHNVRQLWCADRTTPDALTEEGRHQAAATAEAFSGSIDMILVSPFSRTKETAQIFADAKKLNVEVIEDERLREWSVGGAFNNKPLDEYFAVRNSSEDRYNFKAEDGESYIDIITRAGEFLYEIEEKYKGKRILIVTHGAVARALELHGQGVSFPSLYERTREYKNFENAELREIDFTPLPHNDMFELDLHKPYIDSVTLTKDGKKLHRVKEVMDVWFDSGSMPFAQSHYPFEKESFAYPADFISEAIDQTRGWFYTLLAVGVLMGRGTPYKNVICLGHLLDKDGKKMSKSIGNIVEPFEQMDKFGVDAVRFWMYSVNQPGESKNYDEKSVAEINNKVFNLFGNVLSFYELYRDTSLEANSASLVARNVLDQWIIARLSQLTGEMTQALDGYDLFKPTRLLRDFIDDLSTWYLRRSRDRLKDGDVDAKQTLYTVLKTTAQLVAPFAPFFAEHVWQKLKLEGDEESVHLTVWPRFAEASQGAASVLEEMKIVRDVVTKGLELRQKAGIKIRQPLQSLSIEEEGLDAYHDIIKDELNVKEILSGSLALDTVISPELKSEGIARELMRAIQDTRKQKGLTPEDTISLVIGTNETGKEVVQKFEVDIKKTVGANSLEIVENPDGEITVEGMPFSISF